MKHDPDSFQRNLRSLSRSEFLELWASHTTAEIEVMFGVHRSTLKHYARRFNAPRRKGGGISHPRMNEARAPYEAGENIKGIARELGVGANTVQRWAKRGGWKRRPKSLAEIHGPEIKVLTEQGLSVPQIAKRIGRCKDVVRRIITQNGWVRPVVKAEPKPRIKSKIKVRSKVEPAPDAPPKVTPQKPEPVSMVPASDRFTPTMDSRLRREGATYEARARLADEWGLSLGAVTLRWHAVR